MLRKLIRLPMIFIILSFGFFSLGAQINEVKEMEKNQTIIDEGTDIDKKISRLATIMVDYIENRVLNFTEEDWKTYKIKEKKMYLLILFNRLREDTKFNLNEFRVPLRREIYKRLANAIGWVIERRSALLEKIEILYFNIDKLSEMIKGTGKSVVDRSFRRDLGLLKPENAVYEVFLSTNPKEETISMGGKIVTIETGNEMAFSGIYRLDAKSFIESYRSDSVKPPDTAVSQIVPQNVKAENLKVSTIYYQAPDSDNPFKISSNSTVQSGGKIWFEITLPEPGGYLMAYLKDKKNRVERIFNLFPGTRNAVVNGDYRVPFNLDNPYTDIEKIAAENSIEEKLPAEKILIGGYTFDDNPGLEEFSFFYTDQRNIQLEKIIKDAQNIGKDISRMKGVLTGATRIDRKLIGMSRKNIDKTINRPVFYHNKLTLKFVHKKSE